MDFPILDLMDQQSCCEKLLDLLHREGLRCPRCACGRDRYNVHRLREASPVVDYRCKGCRRVFNLFTGTPWQGTHRTPAEILLILRGFAQGASTARLARELGVSRGHLLDLRHNVQARVAEAADAGGRLPDSHVEADEVYQNAGEKRGPPSRPEGPTAAAGQQEDRARHLGHRPSPGDRRGRSRERTTELAGRTAELGRRPGPWHGGASDQAGDDGIHRRMARIPAVATGGPGPRGGQSQPEGVGA